MFSMDYLLKVDILMADFTIRFNVRLELLQMVVTDVEIQMGMAPLMPPHLFNAPTLIV